MVKTVVRHHHWSPGIIGDLFCDNRDFQSLGYWYNDTLKVIKEISE